MPEPLPPRTPPRFVPTLTERSPPGGSPDLVTLQPAPRESARALVSANTSTDSASQRISADLRGPQKMASAVAATALEPVPAHRPRPVAESMEPKPTVKLAARMDSVTLRSAHRGLSEPLQPSASVPAASTPLADQNLASVRSSAATALPAPASFRSQSPAVAATFPGVEGTRQLPVPKAISADFEEMLVHRVLQRVDLALSARLHLAIAAVVQEQTIAMLPRLREEVESVVQKAVNEAVAQELASERK